MSSDKRTSIAQGDPPGVTTAPVQNRQALHPTFPIMFTDTSKANGIVPPSTMP